MEVIQHKNTLTFKDNNDSFCINFYKRSAATNFVDFILNTLFSRQTKINKIDLAKYSSNKTDTPTCIKTFITETKEKVTLVPYSDGVIYMHKEDGNTTHTVKASAHELHTCCEYMIYDFALPIYIMSD